MLSRRTPTNCGRRPDDEADDGRGRLQPIKEGKVKPSDDPSRERWRKGGAPPALDQVQFSKKDRGRLLKGASPERHDHSRACEGMAATRHLAATS